MSRYTKDTPRIAVKFVDSDNDEELFEVNDRNHLNVGELFPASTVNSIVQRELKNRKNLPKKIMVIAVSEYTLND